VDRNREYTPHEAVSLMKESSAAKFDESVEAHFRTGLNVRHADEQLRGTIALPHGLGKEVKIAVFAKGDKAAEAEEAGADVVGAEDLATRVQEGFMDFDVAIATPDMMPIVGRLGRILGPSGKMPEPEGRHRDDGRGQGRPGVQGRQGRVPHRPHGDRPHDRRQDVVLR
jgi:large subunit ribosomal protein L1